MKKTLKRLISSLIAAAMIISAVPVIAADTYSEIVYIDNLEELLAIDGKYILDNDYYKIYYELRADIDLAGIDWEPIYLRHNSTFNGNGHTIKNMTITKECTTKKLQDEWGQEITADVNDIGLFCGETAYSDTDIYVSNLKMTGINIDLTTSEFQGYISPIGFAYSDSCDYEGVINVTSGTDEGGSGASVSIISEGNNCSANVDMTVTGGGAAVFTSCTDCVYNGNVKVNNLNRKVISTDWMSISEFGALYKCKDCEATGYIEVHRDGTYAFSQYYQVIGSSENCVFNGNVKASCVNDDTIGGIAFGSTNCTINGNIEGTNVRGISSLQTIHDSWWSTPVSDCRINGDLNADDGCIGIEGKTNNCHIEGDISGGYAAGMQAQNPSDSEYGVQGSTDCSINGDITGRSGGAVGIGYGINCTVNGDITGSSSALGITGCYNHARSESVGCKIIGNITATNGEAIGIYSSETSPIYAPDASDCFVYGNVTGQTDATGCAADNSQVVGNVTAGSGKATGIYIANNSTIKGNVTGSSADGIKEGDNSRITGNVTATNGYATGIEGDSDHITGNVTVTNGNAIGIRGDNSHITGNVTATNGNAFGIRGDNSHITGNVISNNGDAFGITGTGSGIGGIIRESPPESATLTVSASAPYQAYYKCEYCGSATISSYDNYSEKVHCYRYDENGNPRENYYSLYNDLRYINDSSARYPCPPDEENAPSPVPVPIPSLPPEAYAVQVIEETSDAPLAGAIVTIDGDEYTTDDNGIITFSSAPRGGGLKIEYSGSIVHTETSFYPASGEMNVIRVSPLNLGVEDLYAGDNASARLKGPDVELAGYKFAAFDVPYDFDFELCDELKVAYSAADKTFQVLIGGEGDLMNVEVDANSTSWQKTFKEFKDEYESAKKGNYYVPLKENKIPSPGTLGISGNMDVRGYMEIKRADGESMQVSGGVVLKLSGKVEHVQYLIPGVYLTFSLSGELGGDLKWELVNTSMIDPKINFEGTISAGLTPSAGIGAGARAVLASELGLRGSVDVEYTFPGKKIEEALKAELNASLYGTVYALGHPFEGAWTFTRMEIYPNFGQTASLSSVSIDKPDLYTINREYLNDASPLVDDGITFNGNVYPYSDVQTAALSDGRVMMVWLDDDKERSGMDRTALYYSVLSDGVWSEAKQIDNDGTADFEFDLQPTYYGAAVVWQDSGSHLADDASIDETADTIELSYAEFDGEKWGEAKSVTSSGEAYEYSPKIYFDNYSDSIYIAWKENENNEALIQPGTKESVYRVNISSDDGTVGEKTTICSDVPLIYDIAIGRSGSVAYIADSDGNYETAENKLFIYDDYEDSPSSYGGDTVLTGLQYVRYNDDFMFTENGTLKSINSSVIGLSSDVENIKYLYDSYNNPAVIYEVQDGFTSNLYASYYDSYDGWTNPVPITDFDEKIRSWDAYIKDDSTIGISAVLADIDVNGSDLSQKVRLVTTDTAPIDDIDVKGVYADGDVVRGKNAQFNVYAANNTKNDITSVNVTLKCGDTVLYEGETDVNLIAGETTGINISAPIPDDFKGGTITASVSVPDLAETDTDNNSAQTTVGDAKLSVEMKGNQIFSSGFAQAVIKNVSCEDVSDAVLTVTGENGDEIYSGTIDSIAAGETKKVKIELDEKYYTFTNDYDSFSVKASVRYGENEDTYTYKIKPQSTLKIELDEKSTVLSEGETYKINADFYPAGTSADIYTLSSDENVVTTDGATITAVGEGTATVSVMAVGTVVSSKLTVYVHELAEPVITSAQYTDYSDEYSVYGDVNVTVDTSACLAEGETEKLIVAAYAEDGSLLGVQTNDVQASNDNNVYISASGKKPKYVKAMLWNSLSGIKPASTAAQYEFSE